MWVARLFTTMPAASTMSTPCSRRQATGLSLAAPTSGNPPRKEPWKHGAARPTTQVERIAHLEIGYRDESVVIVDTALFSPDYVSARNRFRDAATRLGCTLESYSIERKGPNGEELSIDVAISPGANSPGVLLVSSGIHGVEGFFGSAVQLGLLLEWIAKPNKLPQIRWVMLHALNPFGFAWRRRVNERNIDLNRNLLLEGQPFSGSPEGYSKLDGLLNPRDVPWRWEPVSLKLMLTIARYGMPVLKQAVASGQYDYPHGLFYGGSQPSRMSEILGEHFDRWLDDSRKVFHLDLHSGLGRWGSCKLLIDHPISHAQRQWLGERFGPASFETGDARGVAYTTRGSLGRWGHSRAGQRDYLYAAAEFGTYKAPRVLAALRAENQCHHWGRPDDPATEQAKRQLVEVFCPRSENWRANVSAQGRQLVERAIGGLAR